MPSELQLLKSVVVLNIKQNQDDIMVDFYEQFHKDVNEMDQQVEEDGFCRVFNAKLDP